MLLGGLAAVIGQGVGAASLELLAGDESLVLEQLQGGVDGAGAGAPSAIGAALELLDDLVAVHRPVLEGREDGEADVAAAYRASAASVGEESAEAVAVAVGVVSAPHAMALEMSDVH